MSRHGMYGLRLTGRPLPDELLTRLSQDAPVLHVEVAVGPLTPLTEHVMGSDNAELALVNGGRIELDRLAASALVRLPEEIEPAELLHPWLAPACGVLSIWLGRHVLHGGVLAIEDRALAVLGHKEAGKSTLVAAAGLAGFDVLADDVVVLERGRVHRGPRCIDLRPPSAQALLQAGQGHVVRDGSRTRLHVDAGSSVDAPLQGFVVLEWADEVSVTRVPVVERLPVLLPHLNQLAFEGALVAPGLLDLALLPVWQLSRPKDWSVTPRVLEELRGLLVDAR